MILSIHLCVQRLNQEKKSILLGQETEEGLPPSYLTHREEVCFNAIVYTWEKNKRI